MAKASTVTGQGDQSDKPFDDRLRNALARRFGEAVQLEIVGEPSMGGSNHTLLFDLIEGSARGRLVMRRETYTGLGNPFLPPENQYRLLQVARRHGIPVPEPVLELTPEDELGRGFVMSYIAGETIPRRIIRDAAFAEARPKLAAQCGEILARIHAIDLGEVDFLADIDDSRDPIAAQRHRLDLYGETHPALEVGLRWLERNRPQHQTPVMLHGDFRNGNFIVGTDGIRAVLDWECSHFGHAMEDLGWLCLRSWRFGHNDDPVGGFGRREDLYTAYQAASPIAIGPAEIHYWEVFGFVRWAVLNVMQGYGHVHENRRSLVFAACGRNTAVIEYDLIETILGRLD